MFSQLLGEFGFVRSQLLLIAVALTIRWDVTRSLSVSAGAFLPLVLSTLAR